jgi:hypothetical protein
MIFCDPDLRQRVDLGEPETDLEKVFWLVDKINYRRSLLWSPHMFEADVRRLGDLVEDLYANWLRERGVASDPSDVGAYLFIVLPYISYRFFNSVRLREVNLWESTHSQRKKIVQCLLDELIELPKVPLARAMVRESVNTFLSFLRVMGARRMQ